MNSLDRFLSTFVASFSFLFVTTVGCDLTPEQNFQKFDPTAPRTPKPSESLSLPTNWVAPEPTRTVPAVRKARVTPQEPQGVAAFTIPLTPTDEQLHELAFFPDPLSPVPGENSVQETRALAAALTQYQSGQISALLQFADTYPKSRWLPSLLLNLGTISYNTGYFTEALRYWKHAWDLAKAGTDAVSTRLANQALAEYAKMNARVGRQEELDLIFAEAQGRELMGDARVKMESAREGRWAMEHRPGIAFRCGPYALTNIAPLLDPAAAERASEFLANIESPPAGFSLNEILKMSGSLGLELQMAKRSAGSAVIVPSVVHWRVGHYGALVREVDGQYLLEDPTFGNETMMTVEAIDQESSGFFLVPEGPLPEGWSSATEAEAAQIYGKGHSGTTDPDETGDDDDTTPDECPGDGGLAMATYRFHILLASLNISDTPVGYTPAFGPSVRLRVVYNQREASQPTSMTFTNFSPQWVSNWVSYIVDNPASPNANITLRQRGGGGEVHKSFNTLTQKYAMQPKRASVLEKLSANTYKKTFPDGSEEYYEQYIGTSSSQRRVFLSRIRDPQGLEVVVEYDNTYPARISRIIDATGLPTEFFYEYSGQPYLVTRVEDPFGREATFTYTNTAGALRLQSIQDVQGIISSFGYNSAGEITSLTTPYGTTTFELSPLSFGTSYWLIRFIEATDPYGAKERIEYNLSSYLTGVPTTLEQPHPSPLLVDFETTDNDDRNSFYWNKQQMKLGAGDYSKAHRYHWVQPTTLDAAMSILESEKPPLEGRIFYNYPGQPEPYIQGTLAKPSVVARVVQDAVGVYSTQADRYEYNALGRRTKAIDPLGRERRYEYESNGIDVALVKQKVSSTPTWETLVSYTYDLTDPPHLPATMTDGAGETTEYTYSSTTGQLLTITNPKGETITFAYEANPTLDAYRRLVSVTGDVPGGNRTFTYDAYGRIRSATDADGHTLTYDFDTLDRIRLVTYPDESFEQYEYSDHSLIGSRDRAGHWKLYAYNALRERIVIRDAIGRVTQQQWCKCGALGRLVDGAGNITEWVRDLQGRVTQKIFADETIYGFSYDFSGRPRILTDAQARTKSFEYALDDRLTDIDYSDAATPDVSYTYDLWYARLATRVDGAGTTYYAYYPSDGSTLGAGRLARVDGPFDDDTFEYAYDELGRVSGVQVADDATHAIATYAESYTYDSRSRILEVDTDLGLFEYGYIGQSNRLGTIEYPNGMLVAHAYYGTTGDLRLKQIKHWSADSTPVLISQFDYSYDQNRNIASSTITQGVATSVWRYTYDDAHQLIGAVRTSTAQTVLEKHLYAYDLADNRIQVATGTTTRNSKFNELNELVADRGFGPTRFTGSTDEPATVSINGAPAKMVSTAGSAPYVFQALVDLSEGNNTVEIAALDGSQNSTSHSYGITTTGTVALYEYDQNGNLRFEKQPNGTPRREFQWDQENRLVRVIQGEHESVFEYDGLSRLIRIVEIEGEEEVENHVLLWCHGRLCQKRDDSGTTIERSYFQRGWVESSEHFFTTRDHLGSTREVMAADGTTLESANDFSPWGELSQINGLGATSDKSFAGYLLHTPSGLMIAQRRAYDPITSRWLSRDPFGVHDGPNVYSYVRGNPVNRYDPTGLIGVINDSSKRVLVGGGTGEGDGHSGKFDQQPLGPGDHVRNGEPLPSRDGLGLHDVDVIDLNGDGVLHPPQGPLDDTDDERFSSAGGYPPAVRLYDDPNSPNGIGWEYCFEDCFPEDNDIGAHGVPSDSPAEDENLCRE